MKGTKLLKICILIIAAVFVINQLFSSLYMPIKTETASFCTASDGFQITGYILRDETLVKSSQSGVYHFVISDGIRVAKGGTIANIYDSENASITVTQMDSLKQKIADMEAILSYNDIEAANLDLLNSRITEKLDDVNFNTAGRNYAGITAYSDSLLFEMNRKQAAMGVTTGLSEQLAALKTELAGLTSSLPAAKGKVSAGISGYFVSKTDGYESALSPKELSTLTPEILNTAKKTEAQADVIGKIVADYEWYVAAKVSINDSLKYKEGDTVKLETTLKSAKELPATVKKINLSKTGDSAVLIFSCSNMNSELASLRSTSMKVINKEYSGLRIPKKALRVVDSVRGVYVQNGMQINFVPVEIVYSGENLDFIICKKDSDSEKYLKLYDKVVVKGKNLYDGKIVG